MGSASNVRVLDSRWGSRLSFEAHDLRTHNVAHPPLRKVSHQKYEVHLNPASQSSNGHYFVKYNF